MNRLVGASNSTDEESTGICRSNKGDIFVCGWSDFDASLVKYHDGKAAKVIAIRSVKTLVYPNPASGVIYIQTEDKIIQSNIYSLSGNMIYSFSGDENREINTELWPAGIYILQLETKAGIATQKIFKN